MPAQVVLELTGNNVTYVPPELFLPAAAGEAASGSGANVEVHLRQNPITHIHDDVFVSRPPQFGLLDGVSFSLFVDVSLTTNSLGLDIPSTFNFTGPIFASPSSALEIRMRQTGVDASAANAFRSFPGGTLSIDMSHNDILEMVPVDDVLGQPFMNLNLSYNQLESSANLNNINGTIDISHNKVRLLVADHVSSEV